MSPSDLLAVFISQQLGCNPIDRLQLLFRQDVFVEGLPETYTSILQPPMIRHNSLDSERHCYPNPWQQPKELPSGLLSKYFPCSCLSSVYECAVQARQLCLNNAITQSIYSWQVPDLSSSWKILTKTTAAASHQVRRHRQLPGLVPAEHVEIVVLADHRRVPTWQQIYVNNDVSALLTFSGTLGKL